MREQVTAVEPNGNKTMDFSVDEPGDPSSSARRTPKFVHPGGSRPLEGYTIKRGVGHGGFGEIYYAVNDAGKEVALKLIRRNLDVELRGIRHCLNLKHPNLLSLYDIREDAEGDTWVVMEYVSGVCMEDAIAANPEGMPLEEALAWFHGLGAGVAYLHDRGIVHRDLKPANIFSDEGVVKVGDYGLSKFISCSRRSGQTESVGTVHYMAPEVANGRYGKEIDVYALGIILYEILTGRVPFEGESVGEVLMKHLTALPEVSMLAEPYRSVVARALEKDPAKRFSSVPEMLAALPQPAQAPPGTGRLPSGTAHAATGGARGEAPFRETVVNAEPVDEEPVFKAVRDACRSLHKAWNDANLNTPVKVILLLAGMFVLVANAGILVPLAVMLVVLYGAYWVVRTLVLSNRPVHGPTRQGGVRPMPSREPPPRQASAQPAAGPPRCGPTYARTAPKRRGRHGAQEQAAAALVVKSPHERLIELVGSLLAGALVAVAMCVVMVLLNSYQSTAPSPERFAWLVLMGIAGTWAVLIPSKFWEGTRGEAALRRFIMMVIGLGLGALAFAVASLLLVELSVVPAYHHPGFFPDFRLPPSFYDVQNGQPLAMAYMACFGTLFLLLRWWRQADPLRSSRLSLWSMIVSGVIAWLVATVWGFPQPWLAMVAATMSVSVQLASPWTPPRKRFRRKPV